MASVSDNQTQTKYNRQCYNYAGNATNYNHQYSARNHAGGNYGMQQSSTDMNALAHSFQGMAMHGSTYTPHNVMGHAAAARTNTAANMASVYGTAGQYAYPGAYASSTGVHAATAYSPHGTHYVPHVGYQAYQTHDNSPMAQNWTPPTTTAGDLPTLVTPRRDSVSSTENDQPATPSYANYASMHGGVAINRSPGGIYSHSTPSPTSVMSQYAFKQPEQSNISPRLKMLVSQDPAIPQAIPAPSSPQKPLDRALENQRGETNVYIRGLLPQTTDEMLAAWGSRFGDIKSSKSIIDGPTGLCKGFGFIKYHNYEDAENCIRGFHYLGYETSFARESFYSKLKTFADEGNTNLYVSNLPKDYNEHMLASLFEPHKVCSARILRDKNGNGRGVGFARFQDREACEAVINAFNNCTIDGADDLQIQIRYADTQEQKSLKQQTQAARQFRTAEYEFATLAWRRGSFSAAGSDDGKSTVSTNEFEQYLGASASTAPSSRWPYTYGRGLPGRSPLGGVPYTNTTASVATAPSDITTGKSVKTESTITSVNEGDGSPTASIKSGSEYHSAH